MVSTGGRGQPVTWQTLGPFPDEGYVLLAPSRRVLVRDTYLNAAALEQWLRSYASPYFRVTGSHPAQCGLTPGATRVPGAMRRQRNVGSQVVCS